MVPYKQLAKDGAGIDLQEFPAPFPAIITRARENAATSSVITLTDNTTVLEVAAIGGVGYLKWIASSDTAGSVVSAAAGANFDNVIAKDTVRRFAVPIESFIYRSSIVGLNKQYGLYNRVALIGAASVASLEF